MTTPTRKSKKKRGNCYVACEALWHILGGKNSGWKPMVMRWRRSTHWFLCSTGFPLKILDPSRMQFRELPNYRKGRGCGFLTKKPSKRAKKLIDTITWQGGTGL